MRILVTGRNGQVAASLRERASEHELIFAHRPEFDLADPASIDLMVDAVAPDLILSAAAYTAVDRAEEEPELAMMVNGIAPGVLARTAAQLDVPIIHLSTDYVFDGSGDCPWREDDPTSPLGVYGASKLAGERAIATAGARHAILRTAWVYSPFGSNFVKTMLRLAETRDMVTVVDDQFGCPTSAFDIADAILVMIEHWRPGTLPAWNGIYHIAGAQPINWAGFARAIFALSAERGGPVAQVQDVPSHDFPQRAVRPHNSRLDCTRFETEFGHRLPDWQASLPSILDRLLSDDPR